jgi:hypothetical protein
MRAMTIRRVDAAAMTGAADVVDPAAAKAVAGPEASANRVAAGDHGTIIIATGAMIVAARIAQPAAARHARMAIAPRRPEIVHRVQGKAKAAGVPMIAVAAGREISAGSLINSATLIRRCSRRM